MFGLWLADSPGRYTICSVLVCFPCTFPGERRGQLRIAQEESMRSTIQALVCGTVCLFSAPAFAQVSPTAQQLQRELAIMKEQMRQMQEKIQQQEEAIEKLSTPAAPPAPTPAPPPPAAGDREQLKQEVREEVLRDIQPQLPAA